MTIPRTKELRLRFHEAAIKSSQDAVFNDANAFIDAMVAVNNGTLVDHVLVEGQRRQISVINMIDYIASRQMGAALPGSKKADSGTAARSRAAASAVLEDPGNQSKRNVLLGYLVYQVTVPFIVTNGSDKGNDGKPNALNNKVGDKTPPKTPAYLDFIKTLAGIYPPLPLMDEPLSPWSSKSGMDLKSPA